MSLNEKDRVLLDVSSNGSTVACRKFAPSSQPFVLIVWLGDLSDSEFLYFGGAKNWTFPGLLGIVL